MFKSKDDVDWRNAYHDPRRKGARRGTRETAKHSTPAQPAHKPPSRISLTVVLVVLIPLVVISLLLIAFSFQLRVAELKQETSRLRTENNALTQQRAFYQSAYILTLRDALRLSSIYGGQGPLYARADDIRREEIVMIWGRDFSKWPAVPLWDPRTVDKRISPIDRSCLDVAGLPSVVNTTVVIVNVTATHDGGELSFYLDGYYLTQVSLHASTVTGVEVSLPQGRHDLALLSSTPDVRIEEVYLDATRVTDVVVVDEGEGKAAFDCQATHDDTHDLRAVGAFRLSFEKT